ncbi:transcription factor bHLH68-like isoform X1 [Senna tora]|uniref:Transcription factor bHLH68-like isoform X1 n=1 Tax=Senna tora TaxID=362788 RepID=A0A834WCM9_9FABA|nr:transcription factor bHLH68-like isoform X1 [Senna tora]
MMAGNPNWWSMHPPSLIPLGVGSSSSSSSIPPLNFMAETQEPTHSWSQMLFAGLPGEEERMGLMSQYFETKKFENWEEGEEEEEHKASVIDVIKQEVSQSGNLYGHDHQQLFQMPSSTPPPPQYASCNSRLITSLINTSTNVLDFTHHNKQDHKKTQLPHHPSQCNNSTASGNKKARVHSSPSQPPLKVRKEKLGDRITALHQLVSPFGKTDTASVLLEATGYIRFLQAQIQALSSPYLAKASKNMRNQHSLKVHGERNAVFPEDPGQLLNDTHGLKRKGATISNQDGEEKGKDLRSRGLCLVPVSCTQHVGSENGADYWAPPYGSGF